MTLLILEEPLNALGRVVALCKSVDPHLWKYETKIEFIRKHT